ncbi:hypothetical protein Vadar_022934 [Vaccinium darrowii]|uniref:Uncharacterized protein n=1 Tax=Vaccinium darrowii TaxID=229202 RepID=A0ACB7Z752_9ERIC|nr:hypothetical protein Vadar_022934 [Vaccinium darrowii]
MEYNNRVVDSHTKSIDFLKRVRATFDDNDQTYKEFLDVTGEFGEDGHNKDVNRVSREVSVLFRNKPDLLVEFSSFLDTKYCLPGKYRNDRDDNYRASIDFLERVRATFDDNDQTYLSFLDIMGNFGEKHNDINKVSRQVSVLFKNKPDLLVQFSSFLETKDRTGEIDEKRFEKVIMIGCEDDLFELDMLRKRHESAIKHCRDFLDDPNSTLVEKYLTVLDKRVIERLYGHRGEEILELLSVNPVGVTSLVLTRLEQKLEELTRSRWDVSGLGEDRDGVPRKRRKKSSKFWDKMWAEAEQADGDVNESRNMDFGNSAGDQEEQWGAQNMECGNSDDTDSSGKLSHESCELLMGKREEERKEKEEGRRKEEERKERDRQLPPSGHLHRHVRPPSPPPHFTSAKHFESFVLDTRIAGNGRDLNPISQPKDSVRNRVLHCHSRYHRTLPSSFSSGPKVSRKMVANLSIRKRYLLTTHDQFIWRTKRLLKKNLHVDWFCRAIMEYNNRVVDSHAKSIDFLKRVRATFDDNDQTYKQFLDVTGEFGEDGHNKDVNRVSREVSVLFRNKPDLLVEFLSFLDTSYCLPGKYRNDREDNYRASFDFLKRVRATFDDNDQTYLSFLDIMGNFGEKNNDINKVSRQISVLFKNKPDLLVEFSRFLETKDCTREIHEKRFEKVIMLRCEDDLFELDMLRKRHESAIKHCRDFLDDPNSTLVEKYLTVLDKRVIERLYGHRGEEFLELLSVNPVGVTSLVLTRLEQKLEELTRSRWDVSGLGEDRDGVPRKRRKKSSKFWDKMWAEAEQADGDVSESRNMDCGNSAGDQEEQWGAQNMECGNSDDTDSSGKLSHESCELLTGVNLPGGPLANKSPRWFCGDEFAGDQEEQWGVQNMECGNSDDTDSSGKLSHESCELLMGASLNK